MLSKREKAQYQEQGFLMKRDLLTHQECDMLCRHISETILRLVQQGERLGSSPKEEDFKASARDIHIFWERGMDPIQFPPTERERCVSRLGHGLHVVDPVFLQTARHPKIAEVLEELVERGMNIVQTMVIYKQPFVGAETGYHQDATYLHTEPNTLIAAWIALDEVTKENSPLTVIPGSHRFPLYTIAELKEDGQFHHQVVNELRPEISQAIPIPVPKGGVIFFHGYLWHGAGSNQSPRPRRAFVAHYVHSASRWSPFNWIDGTPGFVPLREE